MDGWANAPALQVSRGAPAEAMGNVPPHLVCSAQCLSLQRVVDCSVPGNALGFAKNLIHFEPKHSKIVFFCPFSPSVFAESLSRLEPKHSKAVLLIHMFCARPVFYAYSTTSVVSICINMPSPRSPSMSPSSCQRRRLRD